MDELEGSGAGDSAERPAKRGKARFRWGKVALGLALATMAVLLMDIVLDRVEENALTTPPPDILGTWVTDDPRYEDRGFVISAVQFELRLGDGQSSRHVIRSIEGVETGNTWAYEIIYGSPDGDQSFSFYLHPGGILQLKNPPEVVWRREEGDGP